jgi:hypothetical protein
MKSLALALVLLAVADEQPAKPSVPAARWWIAW